MMLTSPDGLNDALQDSTPVQLMRAGFSQSSVFGLRAAYASLGYEAGITSFLDMLADDLTLPRAEDILTKRVVFVVGPSGSGRTYPCCQACGEPERNASRKRSCAGLPWGVNE
jgi:hypothetical protein